MPENTKNITHHEGQNITPKQTETIPREQVPRMMALWHAHSTATSAALDYNPACSDPAGQTGEVLVLADTQMKVGWSNETVKC